MPDHKGSSRNAVDGAAEAKAGAGEVNTTELAMFSRPG